MILKKLRKTVLFARYAFALYPVNPRLRGFTVKLLTVALPDYFYRRHRCLWLAFMRPAIFETVRKGKPVILARYTVARYTVNPHVRGFHENSKILRLYRHSFTQETLGNIDTGKKRLLPAYPCLKVLHDGEHVVHDAVHQAVHLREIMSCGIVKRRKGKTLLLLLSLLILLLSSCYTNISTLQPPAHLRFILITVPVFSSYLTDSSALRPPACLRFILFIVVGVVFSSH